MIKQSLSELKRGDSYKEIFERHLNDLRRCFEIKQPPTPDGVPPHPFFLKTRESSKFFSEKIQKLCPCIFTVLYLNVETLKSMSGIVVAIILMLNSSVCWNPSIVIDMLRRRILVFIAEKNPMTGHLILGARSICFLPSFFCFFLHKKTRMPYKKIISINDFNLILNFFALSIMKIT